MKSLIVATVVVFAGVAAAGLDARSSQDPAYVAGKDGVSNPKVVFEKKPGYTAGAMQAKIQGRVVMQTVVGVDGAPRDVTVTQSLDKQHGLDDRAVEALKAWRFKPATKDGKDVAASVTIEMTFTLRDRK